MFSGIAEEEEHVSVQKKQQTNKNKKTATSQTAEQSIFFAVVHPTYLRSFRTKSGASEEIESKTEERGFNSSFW